MPSVSNLIILTIWTLAIWSATNHVAQIPLADFFTELSPLTLTAVLSLPILFFGMSSFLISHSPFYNPNLAEIINTRFGDNAFESFLVRLRPLLIFALSATLQALLGFWQSYRNGSPFGVYIINGFLLSSGLGFALAHMVLYYRKAVGVFPTRTLDQPLLVMPERKTLPEILHNYWWILICIVLFPSVFSIGSGLLNISFEFFILPFFAIMLLAALPLFLGKAPYSFWFVVIGVWILGGVIASILYAFII